MKFIEVLKALSHENRLRILNLLRAGKLCVCELESVMGVNQSNASRHLTKLKQAELIKSEQQAQWVYYYLNQRLIGQHPFLKELIDNELDKLEICQEDSNKLERYHKSGLSCEDLTTKEIDLSKI